MNLPPTLTKRLRKYRPEPGDEFVTVTDIVSNQTETFTILGAWDSDPDHGIISYLTPVAMALVNHKVGDEVEIEMLGQKRRQRIEAIAAWKTEAAPAPEAAVEPAPTI